MLCCRCPKVYSPRGVNGAIQVLPAAVAQVRRFAINDARADLGRLVMGQCCIGIMARTSQSNVFAAARCPPAPAPILILTCILATGTNPVVGFHASIERRPLAQLNELPYSSILVDLFLVDADDFVEPRSPANPAYAIA